MRKIVIITGSRADATPMASLMEALQARAAVKMVHFITEGLFGVEEQVYGCLKTEKPDMVVLLGDRYETLVAASVAHLLAVPVAHLSGGDETEGAVDNAFRHAITKLSYWHFPIHAKHADRIMQMGENPNHIVVWGAPAVDNLTNLMTKEECEARIGHPITHPTFIVCYHPETLSEMPPCAQVGELLRALDKIPEAFLIVTGSNSDIGGAEVSEKLQRYVANHNNAIFSSNYDRRLYNSLLKHCTAVVGNSSTGVIEAPILGTVSINIGRRQSGRDKFPTVLDAVCEKGRIVRALTEAINHQRVPTEPLEYYGKPGAVGWRIAQTLCEMPIPKLPTKAFNDN